MPNTQTPSTCGPRDRDGAGLERLRALLEATPRGVAYTQEEIAEVYGSSVQNIQIIERRALEKLRRSARLRQWL